ncbi:MAG: MAPEG family protein [Myxococcota bacterium]
MAGWNILALTIAALFLKQVLVVLVQVVDRLRTKTLRHPEDAKLLNASVGDSPLTERAQAVIRNSLENEAFFLFLLFALFSINADGQFRPHYEESEAAVVYASVFVGARYAHALFFLLRVGGLRSLAFTAGLLAAVGVAVQVVIGALA